MQLYWLVPGAPAPAGVLAPLSYAYLVLPLVIGLVVGRFWVVPLFAVTPVTVLLLSLLTGPTPSATEIPIAFLEFFPYLGFPVLLGVIAHQGVASAREDPRGAAAA